MERYLVIVQSMGTAYRGSDPADAVEAFDAWELKSRNGEGRASNRAVWMLSENELVREYQPKAVQTQASNASGLEYAPA